MDIEERPVRYMAIESLQRGKFTEKTDIWSFAVLAWELLSRGIIPYYLTACTTDVITRVVAGVRLPFPKGCNLQLWATLQSCWAERSQDRPNFSELDRQLNFVSVRVDCYFSCWYCTAFFLSF